jgi:hypothetical protein
MSLSFSFHPNNLVGANTSNHFQPTTLNPIAFGRYVTR